MNVNWRWHARFRGLLPLSPHALSDDGTLLVVRPDELEARRYQVLRVNERGAAEADTSLTVETVRQLYLTTVAPMLIGVTDDDLYLFREGRKTRFLPDRRVSYLSVALAASGSFFAAAFTDMLFAGQTLALADSSGKVVWTKDLDAPISVVGISPEGRVAVVGLETGRLAAFDASRSLLWDAVLDSTPVALALTGQGARCIVATASGVVVAIDNGDVAWRSELPVEVDWTPGSVSVACDEHGAVAALAGGGGRSAATTGGGWVVLLDAEGRSGWEQVTEARVTGAALAPAGRLLALSQSDGELLQLEFEPGGAALGDDPLATEEAFRRALAARDAGKTDEARQALLRVLEADPGHLPACQALIALDDAMRSGVLREVERLAGEARFAEALAELSTARTADPADSDLTRRWSEILSLAQANAVEQAAQAEAQSDLARAVGHWRSLLQLDPKCLRGREEVARLNRQIAEQLTCEGEAALAAGREDDALAVWRRAQAIAPSEALAARLRDAELQRYFRSGVALYGQQRFQEAAFQFRKVLAIQADHAEALRYLAYISSAGPQSLLSERFSRLE